MNGVVNPRDFVQETEQEREQREFGGLTPEERAMIASAEAAAEAERAEMLSIQQREYEEGLAKDRLKYAEAEKQRAVEQSKRVAEQKQAEEAEAKAIWRHFEKQEKLEHLPPEPPTDDTAALQLTITMLSTGRRLGRRWSP